MPPPKKELSWVSCRLSYCTDNAAMIAAAGQRALLLGQVTSGLRSPAGLCVAVRVMRRSHPQPITIAPWERTIPTIHGQISGLKASHLAALSDCTLSTYPDLGRDHPELRARRASCHGTCAVHRVAHHTPRDRRTGIGRIGMRPHLRLVSEIQSRRSLVARTATDPDASPR